MTTLRILAMVAILAVASVAVSNAINTRVSLRTGHAAGTDPAASHHDFGKDYKGSEAAKTDMDKLHFEFDGQKEIRDTKKELMALLESFRTNLKKHFVDLEKVIHDKINGIFQVACPVGAEDGSCWVAMKVECQVYDVQDYVHYHRCNLVTHVKNKLMVLIYGDAANGVVGFDDYLKKRGLDCTGHAYDMSDPCTSDATSIECKCNTKMEIDGILGMHLQKGDTEVNAPAVVTSTCKEQHESATPPRPLVEVWAMDKDDQCNELHQCVATTAPPCAADAASGTYCGDVIDTDSDHTCLSKHPVYNKDDTGCVKQHLGLLGLTNYYGGSCLSDQLDRVGRVGRLIDTAFVCAIDELDESKVSCTASDRAANEAHCVADACDCACVCGSHLTCETLESCDNWKGKADGPQECDANTCMSDDWRKDNKCPHRPGTVGAMSASDCKNNMASGGSLKQCAFTGKWW